ncbi:auxin-responsive protein IAA4 isoform X1 [Elaeis guineensis]|uniref:Auxin-responsive protein n=1 Tax=Elaeis guineensis var. tenera TaxID=51953 RepID=A0A6I9QH85_ELAGV|nr:auxin-responsive protein IAA4 isoform X1 [Elaeis guineensis]
MGGGNNGSPSSSIDSSSHPALSTASSLSQPRRDLSTDLRLGLSLSASSLQDSSSSARDQLSDWPPIKPLLRSTLAEKGHQIQRQSATFFVKVYMEGIPIGRKLDLFALDGYDGLIKTLRRMFRTSIMRPDIAQVPTSKDHVLTYEDKEGDWMMVGDVPWEMFLTTVKRLKITRADKC